MIPPTIENARYAGPLPDGRWAVAQGHQALILKESRSAEQGLTAEIVSKLVQWEAAAPLRRARLLARRSTGRRLDPKTAAIREAHLRQLARLTDDEDTRALREALAIKPQGRREAPGGRADEVAAGLRQEVGAR